MGLSRAPLMRAHKRQHDAQHLRQQHDGNRAEKEVEGLGWVDDRPYRKERFLIRKIHRQCKGALEGKDDADEQREGPERGGQIGIDAHGQVKPADPRQARRSDDAQMLQVALRPAPVPNGNIDERWWAALVGAVEMGKHAHLPSCAPQEGRLDEIVALDVATQGRPAAKVG